MRGCLALLLLLLLARPANAQFPNPSMLNTGSNAAGTGVVPLLSNDLNWTVAMPNILGPYVPAVMVGTQLGWSPSPFTNANWICFPHTCSVTPADHSCDALLLNEYYKLTFDLPALNCSQSISTPSAYCLSLDFMADNCVREIFVNGTSNYLDTSPNPGLSWGFLINNKITVSLCNNWIAGTNTILVHVISGANANGGLVGFLAQVNQTVNPTVGQALSASGTQTNVKCSGGASGIASVSASGSPGPYTYTWLPNGGNANTATGLAAGVYTCMIESSNLCKVAKTFTITQPAPLQLGTAVSSPSACVNSSVSLSAGASGGTPGYSYTWSPGTQPNPYSATQATSGLYTYTATARDANDCLASGTVQVLFSAPPPVTVTHATVCANTSLTLTASGAATYTWIPAGVTTATYALTPGGSGAYTVLASSAGCTTSATASVTVRNVSITISASTPSACMGDNIQLTATGSGGTPAYTYTWAGGPAGNVQTVSPLTAGSHIYVVNGADADNCAASGSISIFMISTPLINASSATICLGSVAQLVASGGTTYTWLPSGLSGSAYAVAPVAGSSYTVVGSVLGCTAAATASVLVNPVPAAGISYTNFICAGQPLHLYGTGNGTYSWAGPAAFTSTLQNPVLTPAYPGGSGSYSLTVTGANGCTSSTLVPVSILPLPLPAVSHASVCEGEPVILNASGGSSYQWSGPAGFSSGISNPSIIVTAATAGNYTVVVTLNTCTAQAVANVAGNPYPLPVVSISGNTAVCLNANISLLGAGGSSYAWTGPNNYFSVYPEIEFAASSPAVSGIYTLSVKNASNCSASGTVQVTVYPLPAGSITSSIDRHCIPFCSVLSLKTAATNNAPIVSTSFSDGTAYSGSSDSICFNRAGTYTVSARFTDSRGCSAKSELLIHAYPLPLADFEYSPPRPVAGFEPVHFTNTSSGEQITQWNWFFDAAGEAKVLLQHPSRVYDDAGSHPVAMIVTNAWGCSDTAVKYINVFSDFSLYVPNAFTPDGDQLNEIFQPKGIGIGAYELQVFNRWGELIFSSTDFTRGWDGTYKGQPCKVDTYAWKISLQNTFGQTRKTEGHVSLIR